MPARSSKTPRAEDSEEGEDGYAGSSHSKKKNNVSRACNGCRRRRTRCDGRPQCSTCQTHEEECSYDREQDGRRPAAKGYVIALETRVKDLERQIESLRRANGQATQEGESGEDQEETDVYAERLGFRGPPSTGAALSRRVSSLKRAVGAMRVGGDGSPAHYGPTSAYMHLPQTTSVANESDVDRSASAPPLSLASVDWSIRWDANLPTGVIKDVETHRTLLSLFFSYLNDWCQWCDEGAFLSGLITSVTSQSQTELRSAHYSPLLHNALLSLTCLLAPEEVLGFEERRRVGSALAQHAKGLIEEEAQSPMSTTVRGLMLLGSFFLHNGQRNLGWLYEGMGARTAQILGLHIDSGDSVANGEMTLATKQHRVRSFYTMYIQDVLWGLNVGRTISLHYQDFETSLPEVDQAQDTEPWIDYRQRLAFGASTTHQRLLRPGWKSTTFLWTCRLAIIADKIHSTLYHVRSHELPGISSLISKLDLDLHTWHVNLPVPIRIECWGNDATSPGPPPHVLNMHAFYHYLRILLHRPAYMLGLSGEQDARKLSVDTCNSAAEEIVNLFSLYIKYIGLQFSTTTLPNIAFMAGSMFLMAAVKNDASREQVEIALSKVDRCIDALHRISWPAAAIGEDILKRMKEEWCPPDSTYAASKATTDLPTIPVASSSNPLPQDEMIRALQDPQSEMSKLLSVLGWAPPIAQPAVDVPDPAPGMFLRQYDDQRIWGLPSDAILPSGIFDLEAFFGMN